MLLTEVTLRSGIQASTGIASFACLAPEVYPDGRVAVILDVSTGSGDEYLLHPGDTFPVHDQTWQLDRVDDPGTGHWRVRLIRIG
jgi:hypothetical protein